MTQKSSPRTFYVSQHAMQRTGILFAEGALKMIVYKGKAHFYGA